MEQTSLEAWAQYNPGPAQLALLTAYGKLGPGSARNVEEIEFGDTARQLWKRAPELVRMGLLEETGATEKSVSTGIAGKIRRITDGGRARLQALGS